MGFIKKFTGMVLVLLLIFAAPLAADAANEVLESGNLTDTIRYTLYADGTLLIEGTGELEELTEYPSGKFHTLEIGEGISGIVYFDHSSRYEIQRLSIPSTMKEMESSFSASYELRDLELNEGVEVIGKYAFSNCISLETVVLPSTVTEIGYRAFSGCEKLTEIVFTGDPAAVSDAAFYDDGNSQPLTIYYPADRGWKMEDMSSMGRIIATWIPYTLDEAGSRIADETQAYVTKFSMKTSGTLGDNGSWHIDSAGVLHIEGTGDIFTENLVEVYWYDIAGLVVEPGVTEFYHHFTEQYEKLKTVKFTDALSYYPVFYRCGALESVDYGDAATIIAETCGLQKICEVTVPASVSRIANNAFYNCKSLETVTFLGSAPTEIEGHCFGRVGEVTMYYPAGDPSWTDEVMRKICCSTGVWIPYTLDDAGNRVPDPGQAKKFLGIVDSGEDNDIQWTLYSDGLLRVEGTGTLHGNHGANSIYTDVRRVEFSDGITGIGEYAFAWCHQLTDITLPEGLEEIGEWAFYECTSLTSIEIPGSLESISDFAFTGCSSLYSVTLNEGLKYIGVQAFHSTSIQELVVPSTVLELKSDAFSNCKLEKVTFMTKNLSRIPEGCFARNPIQKIIIPKEVKSIDYAAFWNCTDLSLVIFEGEMPEINWAAFSGAGQPVAACLQEYSESFSESRMGDALLSGPVIYSVDEEGSLVSEQWDTRDLVGIITQAKQKYPEGYSLGQYSVAKLNAGNLEGYGSQAFAYILSDMLFRSMPSELDADVTFDDVQVGDILRLPSASRTTESGRAVVVIEKNADTVTVVQGNWHETPDAPGTVHWGEVLTREQVEAAEYRITRYVRDLLANAGEIPSYEPEWPSIDGNVTEEAMKNLILSLKDSYPEGFPYTTDIVYASKAENTWFDLIGLGCSAFAYRVSDMAFGTAPMRYVTAINYDDIMVGDILHYDPDPNDDTTHVVVVLEVYQECVVTVEANYGGVIHWGNIFTSEQVEGMIGYYTRYPEGTQHPSRGEYPGDLEYGNIINGVYELSKPDSALEKSLVVHDVYTGEERPYSYEVPEDGVTMLVFFATQCGYSQSMFSALNKETWLDNPALNIVAVACEYESTEDLQSFISTRTGNVSNLIEYSYAPSYMMSFEYHYQYSSNNSLTWPVVVLITENDGIKTLRYATEGPASVDGLYNRLCKISESFAFHEGHEHSFEAKKIVAPTCREGGYTEYVCSCGKEEQRDFVEPLAHSWVEATCEAPRSCSVCGYAEGEPLAHKFDNGVCTACGAQEKPALMGDIDGNGVVNYKDAMLVLRVSIGLDTLEDKSIADIDGNGAVNYKDAMKILRMSIGLD